MRVAPRAHAQALFSPQRYHKRWQSLGPDGSPVGMSLQELEASAVRDPGTGRLWLLHRRMFRMVRDSEGRVVADPEQKVPVCMDCFQSLAKTRPTLPKMSLANDLWIGKLPKVQVEGEWISFKEVKRGTWWLMQLARPVMRQV